MNSNNRSNSKDFQGVPLSRIGIGISKWQMQISKTHKFENDTSSLISQKASIILSFLFVLGNGLTWETPYTKLNLSSISN